MQNLEEEQIRFIKCFYSILFDQNLILKRHLYSKLSDFIYLTSLIYSKKVTTSFQDDYSFCVNSTEIKIYISEIKKERIDFLTYFFNIGFFEKVKKIFRASRIRIVSKEIKNKNDQAQIYINKIIKKRDERDEVLSYLYDYFHYNFNDETELNNPDNNLILFD